MMNRCKKFVIGAGEGIILDAPEEAEYVLEAGEGIVFDVFEGEGGNVVVRARNVAISNEYSRNYVNPPIPEQYEHIEGTWNNGFVIERKFDKSQFVWIPVGDLEPDGVLDGEHYSERFGRRNYCYKTDEFSDDAFSEEITYELIEQIASVKKYGGFYISRYQISRSSIGEPQSVKGYLPWVNIGYDEAKRVAESFEQSNSVKSHLTFGAEYDSVLAWIIKSDARSVEEIVENSKTWGNHKSQEETGKKGTLLATGSCENWCANGIYDLAGNVDEWTQERNFDFCYVTRGSSYEEEHSVAERNYYGKNSGWKSTGFRIVLCIK